MQRLTILALLLGLTMSPHALPRAVPQGTSPIAVTLVVEDGSGAPVRDQLVILQGLDDHGREIGRALTDMNGEIPILNVQPGLYRAIATAPYGLWQTRVREFLVNDLPVRMVLIVESMPTHGNGDVVTIGNEKMFVRVLDSDGHPAVGASVLARDQDDTLYLERWYKTDRSGGATVEVVSDPLVLVVIFGKTLITREIPRKTLEQIITLPRL